MNFFVFELRAQTKRTDGRVRRL